MTTLEEIDELHRFASDLPEEVLLRFSIEQILSIWKNKLDIVEVLAIQEALDDYDRGKRGQPVDEFLAEVRTKRQLGADQ